MGEYLAGDKGSVLPAFITLFFTLMGTFITFTAIILHSISRLIQRQGK